MRHISQRRTLTDLQQAILDVLWAKGPATADQVRAALQPSFPLKDSSVRTLLRRLEARGYLRHEVDGKAFVYHPTLRPRSVAARAVRHLIDRFCQGSAEQFLRGMVDEKVLTLAQIRRLAGEVKKRR
ncbi:MAG: BlaI/MecI/CopY family transcriptional regulator [Vicinamibacterales bacterium]